MQSMQGTNMNPMFGIEETHVAQTFCLNTSSTFNWKAIFLLGTVLYVTIEQYNTVDIYHLGT